MKAYLQLMRPANLVTALADVVAGAALAQLFMAPAIGPFLPSRLWLLAVATVGLYGGGVVLNDVFDAELDAVERPERPIPSGRVPVARASVLGVGLLLAGVGAAVAYGPQSGWLAVLLAGLAVFYDRFGKHMHWFGPVNMGLCRGLNLLLGLSAAGGAAVAAGWPVGLVPVVYIAAITAVSRGEVHGGSRAVLWTAAVLFLAVSLTQLGTSLVAKTALETIPFLIFHVVLLARPLWRAIREPVGPNIGRAVKAGVLSLIVMDAAWVAAAGNQWLALAVVALLPASVWLARQFAVT